MRLRHHVKTAFRGLKTNKSRSLLTILGIVIGITAIIIVMSIGQGARNLILNQIEGLGANTITIEAGKEPNGPSNFAELFTDSLKQKDVDALKRQSNVQGITRYCAGGDAAHYQLSMKMILSVPMLSVRQKLLPLF
jgi:putative ABC transport system permease protein